jgi:hypothetical protein
VATARLLDLIRDFDALCGWGNGFLSCAHWLNYRVGIGLHAAREQVRTARALGQLPHIAEAFARGTISYSKVRALTRVATPATEERLLTFATHGTAAHVERLAAAWRRVDRAAEERETLHRHRSCSARPSTRLVTGCTRRCVRTVRTAFALATGSNRPTRSG